MTCFLYFFLFFGVTIFTLVFSPICQKIFRTTNTACNVTVILSRFFVLLRGGESHCIWRHLSLAQLSLQSGFQWRGEKKKRENVSMQACDKSSNQTHISSAPICGNLVMFSPPQHHEHSGKNWRCAQYIFILLHIIIECLQASTTEYDTHVF